MAYADPVAAQAALLAVAQATFALSANVNDATYGAMFQTTRFINTWPVDSFQQPLVSLYLSSGQSQWSGLGYNKQWTFQRLKLNIFGRNQGEVDKAESTIESCWISDLDFENGNGTVGQQYLRLVGGIKSINMSPPQALLWERTGVQFRRQLDVTIELLDV
jgi:hypothetical protein